jgi:DNA-binding GntR family transcriptional regulator
MLMGKVRSQGWTEGDLMDRQTIYRDIRARIESGEYPRGSKLPKVEELTASYGASKPTVLAALTHLSLLGLVSVGKGRGGITVTAGPRTASHLGTFPPADQTTDRWKPDSADTPTSVETTLRQVVAEGGEFDGNDIIVRDYLRKVDDVPVQHKRTEMPLEFASVIPEGYTTPPMLTPAGGRVPEPPKGISPNAWYGWGIKALVTSITLEAAADDVAEALGLPTGTPVLQQRTQAVRADDTTVYVTTVTVPAYARMTMVQLEREA